MSTQSARSTRRLWRRVLIAGCLLGVGAIGYARYQGRDTFEYLARGDKFFQEGNFTAAAFEYRGAFAREPRNLDIVLKLAKAYEKARDGGNTVRQYVRAADLRPEDDELQLTAAKWLLSAQRFEEARARADAVIKRHPNNALAFIVRGNATAGMKDLDTAVSDLEKAVRLEPERGSALINLAGLQLAGGKSGQAEAAFRRAVEVAPKSVDPYVALAAYYRHVGRPVDAEQALKSALAFAPTSVEANAGLASLYLEGDRAAEAETPLRALAETGTPEYRLALADFYATQNRTPEAMVLLKELMREERASVPAQSRLAGLDYQAGRRDAAHRALDALLLKDPKNAAVLVVKGGWLLGEGKPDEAQARAEQAVAVDAELPAAHALLAATRTVRGDLDGAIDAHRTVLRLDPTSVPAQVEIARLYLRLNRPEQARPFAQEAVTSQPGNGVAHVLLAAANLAMGNLGEVEEEARLLVAGAPSRPEGHAFLGEVLLRRGDKAGARRAFDTALKQDPASVDALAGLVRLDIRDRQPSTAQARIDARLADSPNDPRLLMLRARAQASAGDYEAAEASMKRVIELEPGFLEAYVALGQVYVKQGKLQVALQEYDAITAKQPRNVAAHTMVAMLLQAQGKMNEARVRYERILDIDRRAVVAANNLAFLHAETGGNLDVALNLAQSAKAAAPDDPDVDDTLGWVYVKRDLPHLAVEPLERSVKKDPKNAQFQYHLGMAYVKMGDRAKARDVLDRAIALGLSQTEAADATKVLAAITIKG